MSDESKRVEPNPYDWQGASKSFVGREALLQRATAACLNGEGVFLLLGTRGMGKSALLAHLEIELHKNPELEVVYFSSSPFASGPALIADDILLALCESLLNCARKRGKAAPGDEFDKTLRELTRRRDLRGLFDAYLDEFSEQTERIVLLYDEVDSYASSPTAAHGYFNALENERKKLDKRLVVAGAGGLGMLSLKTVFGSPIFSRAERKILEPFQEDELRKLAKPFDRRGAALSTEVLSTLLMLSGGNLALATYGLQNLWDIDAPSPRHLVEAFDRFRDNHNDFGAIIRGAIFGFDESAVPFRVWKRLKTTGGRLSKAEMTSIRRCGNVKNAVESKDILDMLRAGGLIRMNDSAWKAEPIIAEIIPSILSFDDLEEQRSFGTLKDQLRADLVDAMADIHRMTPAYYRPGSKERNEEKQLVPEAVFAAVLASSLGGRGWKVELESMSGAGFADITASHPRFGEELAKVEVKIWPRKVGTIHDQITSYFTKGVAALATVVIADLQDPTWKDSYESQCLTGKAEGASAWIALELPLEGYFEAQWKCHVVEHFLLRLAARS